MMVQEYTVEKMAPTVIDGKTVHFRIMMEGVTTKEELDRFQSALNDGAFLFKRVQELGAKPWEADECQ